MKKAFQKFGNSDCGFGIGEGLRIGEWGLRKSGNSKWLRGAALALTLALSGAAQAQVTIFSENFGTPTNTTSITTYATGNAPATFQNKGVLTFSQGDQTTPADVRVTSPSSGYTGVSGNGNIFFTSSSGAYGFSIESINAQGYSSLQLSYGYRKESASLHATFSVDYWNGSAWVTIANSSSNLFNEASSASTGWYLAKTLSLPTGAAISGLKIRFVKTGTASIRIDDVKLTGALITPTISLSTNSLSLGSTTANSPSTPVSYTVSGTNLGSTNITITPSSSLVEISTNSSSNFSTNSLTLTQSSGVVSSTTIFARIAAVAQPTSNFSATIGHVSGTASNTLSLTGSVDPAGQPPVVTSTNLSGQVGVAFSNAITASGGATNFNLASGTLPGGLTFNSNNGTITGTPTNAVSTNITVTADNSFGTSSNAATIGVAIAKGTQTITFAALPAKVAGDAPFTLSATANSTLTVSYASSSSSVATVSGNTVTVVGAGTTTITASQVGDDNWNAATDVSQTLTVYPSGMAYWNFNTDTPTVVPSGWTIGAVSQGNNNGTTTMLSSISATNAAVYSNALGVAASLSTNAQAAARIGAINTGTIGSAYFEFTVTAPLSSTNLAITNIFFGYRCTSTGPQGYSIRSSADNYAADIPGGSGALANNSIWAAVSAPVSVLMTNGQNTTFRIYGRDGTGAAGSGSANWRIDDLTLAIGALGLNQPSLTLTPSSLSGLSTFNGTSSAGTSYIINGSNLTNEVTVTPSSTVLEVSSNNINFTNTLNISPSLGSVSNTTLYVRISGTAGQGALTGAYVRHVSTGLTNDLAVAGNVYDATRGASSNSLIGWDASGQTNFGNSPWNPTTQASNLIVSSGLSRTSGVATSGSSTARAWGGVGWSQADGVTAVASNQFVFFTIAATNGYKLSLSGISKLDYRRPASGPTGGVLQVQIGAGTFSDVANLAYPSTANTGDSVGAIDLSTNTLLQNIPANTQVTFRIANFGGTNTGSGTWYIYDKDNSPNLDFEVTGALVAVPAPSGLSYSSSMLSGTVGTAISGLTPEVTGEVNTYAISPTLPAGLSINATSGVISGTPTAVAASASYTVTASNSGGSTTASVTISVAAGGSTFAGWRGANPASADLLMQYAYGAASPTTPLNRSNLPSGGVNGSNLVLTYFVRQDAQNANLVIPQMSANLADTNTWNTNGIIHANLGTNSVDGVDVVKKTASVPIDSTNRKFLRLKISE